MVLRFAVAAAFLFCTGIAHAFTLPTQGAGSDGAFAPLVTTEIDLGLATPGAWDTTSGTGNGVYDPAQWLVIFRYNFVNIPQDVTITFKNHPSGAPVLWLVQGTVTITGHVNLDGQIGTADPARAGNHPVPGPGGFPGGRGNSSAVPASGGYGPGGGSYSAEEISCSGVYATSASGCAGQTYGNAEVFPLIGGSGAAGSSILGYGSGGAGGGAILIATTGSISINGQISANGGGGDWSGGGSGGAIKLIAENITGTGALNAVGGRWDVHYGGDGRIRVESNNATLASGGNPPFTGGVPASEPKLFVSPGDGTPIITSVTLGGNAIPADTRPRRLFPSDVEVEQEGPQTVALSAQNVPSNATIKVRVVPRSGPDGLYDASFVSTGPGENESQWTAEVTMPEGFSSIQAYAILTE